MCLAANGVLAALIHGSVYDMDLRPAKNVIVEVNTSPIQRYLAKSGNYSFRIPTGVYHIKTQHQYEEEIYKAEETISIVDNGVYVLDLFLFPDISEDESLFEQANVDFGEPKEEEQNKTSMLYALIIVMILGVVGLGFFVKKAKRKEKGEPARADYSGNTDYSKKIIYLLKSNQGRMTQKEIRKDIPLSEAKVSLLISELEAKQRLERIKKGRGNIIILK